MFLEDLRKRATENEGNAALAIHAHAVPQGRPQHVRLFFQTAAQYTNLLVLTKSEA